MRLQLLFMMLSLSATMLRSSSAASRGRNGLATRASTLAFQANLLRRGPARHLVAGARGKKDNTDTSDPANMYRDTVALPQTGFDQRANAPVREPQIQNFWEEKRIYQSLYENPKGKLLPVLDITIIVSKGYLRAVYMSL